MCNPLDHSKLFDETDWAARVARKANILSLEDDGLLEGAGAAAVLGLKGCQLWSMMLMRLDTYSSAITVLSVAAANDNRVALSGRELAGGTDTAASISTSRRAAEGASTRAGVLSGNQSLRLVVGVLWETNSLGVDNGLWGWGGPGWWWWGTGAGRRSGKDAGGEESDDSDGLAELHVDC